MDVLRVTAFAISIMGTLLNLQLGYLVLTYLDKRRIYKIPTTVHFLTLKSSHVLFQKLMLHSSLLRKLRKFVK